MMRNAVTLLTLSLAPGLARPSARQLHTSIDRCGTAGYGGYMIILEPMPGRLPGVNNARSSHAAPPKSASHTERLDALESDIRHLENAPFKGPNGHKRGLAWASRITRRIDSIGCLAAMLEESTIAALMLRSDIASITADCNIQLDPNELDGSLNPLGTI
jgi:hypothetical protein